MAQTPPATDASTDGPEPRGEPARAPSEDVFVRNYDPYRRYDLSLVVADPAGDPILRREYSLRPGQIRSLRGALEPGAYEVRVVLDDRREKTASCRVGPDADETIHVEIGNGLVSVTEGLFG